MPGGDLDLIDRTVSPVSAAPWGREAHPRALRAASAQHQTWFTPDVTTVAFLHTADMHVATFSGLLSEVAPGAMDVHLAHASMAPGADLLGDLSIPVLSSPRLALLRAVALADA